MRLERLGPTALLLALTSCVSAPPREAPELGITLPEHWTAAAVTPNLDDTDNADTSTDSTADSTEVLTDEETWWREFRDPQLDALVLEAALHNHDLDAAAARVLASTALARISGADNFPQVGLGFDALRTRQNFIGFPVPGGGNVLTTRSTAHSLSLNVSWELDVWGRLRARSSAAIADVQATAADYAAVYLSLTGQVAELWFQILELHGQAELAQATLEAFNATSAQVRDRYERGLRPPLDLRLALTNVSTAEAVLEQRRGQLDLVIRQLEVLLGRYPSAELEVRDAADLITDLFDTLPASPAPVPAGLPAELLSRRPDLAAAERRLAASGARIKEARAALYPRISLTASGGTRSDDLGDLLNGKFSVWTLAANVLQPVFQGGRLIAGIDLAVAEQQDALADYVQSALFAFAEVESSLTAEQFLARRELALRDAVEQAVAAQLLAEDRYSRGLEDFVTVLESQRTAFLRQSELLVVRRQRLDVRVNLHLALGGGFHHEVPESGDPPPSTDESSHERNASERDPS